MRITGIIIAAHFVASPFVALADEINIDVPTDGDIFGTNADDTFNFNAALTGTASGLAGDDEFNVNVNQSGQLDGGEGSDTFNINDGGSAGSIDGGAGIDTVSYATRTAAVTVGIDAFTNVETLTGSTQTDTLQGTAAGDTFTVNAADAGTANGINFTSFENLSGLAGDDTFNMNAGVSGTVDGGAGSDQIVGTLAAANAFVVNAANAGAVNGTAFANVENLTGGAAADDFTFTAALTGTASGGGGDDTFNINDGGSAGSIDGGTGTDTVTYASRVAQAAVVAYDQFTSVETLTGSFLVAADALTGTGGDDTFTVNGLNAGSATPTGGGGVVNFTSFENLSGLGGNDTFNMNAAVDGIVDGGGQAGDVIVGIAGGNTFNITAADGGTVNGTQFANVANLTGGAAVDTFTFTGTLSGTASGLGGNDTFNINDGGDINQSIDGGTGTDIVSYAARTGSVTASLDQFANVEAIVGSAFDDTFIIDTNFMGTVDGGPGSESYIFGLGSSVDTIFFDFGDTFLVEDLFAVTPAVSAGDDLFLLGFLLFEFGDVLYRDTLADDFMRFASFDLFDGFLISDASNPFAIIASASPPPSSVPEPGTLALLGIGLFGMGLARRNKKI